MIKEFKDFIMRSNVLDLAVAVVIGAAFGKIVDSLVENIIMPLIALLFGNTDFASSWQWNGIHYGIFVQSIIDFLIIGFAVFMFVKLINKLTFGAFEEETEEENVVLLREILEEMKQNNEVLLPKNKTDSSNENDYENTDNKNNI